MTPTVSTEEILQILDRQHPYIDNSQYHNWMKCPWYWFEKAVQHRQKAWPSKQRDDALAIGTLVHAGLEVWQRDHRIEIPQSVIDEIGPTPDALTSCRSMVYGYAQAYPQEHWPLIRCEQPLRFPLIEAVRGYACSKCPNTGVGISFIKEGSPCLYCGNPLTVYTDQEPIDGLAKLDAYFEVPEQTVVESGIEGYECVLSPGLWIHEYKTKADSLSMALWIQRWEIAMQANFQLLALGELYGEKVQGILVNIIEKPRLYVPKRKCKACSGYFELLAWLPSQTAGESECPACHESQKLNRGNTSTTFTAPRYYRITVTRTAEALETAKTQIAQVAGAMQYYRSQDLTALPPNTEQCVDARWGECEYYRPHTYKDSTLVSIDYEPTKDYVGETITL